MSIFGQRVSGSGESVFVGGIEAAGDIQTSGSLLARHHVSGSGKGLFVSGVEAAGDIQTSGSLLARHNVSGSGKGLFVGGIETAGPLSVTGSSTFAGNVTVKDDKKLYFGTGNDAYIEYDEDGTDELIVSGAAGGIDIKVPWAVADALTISTLPVGNVMTFDTTGGSATEHAITSVVPHSFSDDMDLADDKKLYFGTDDDAYIEYDEDGTDELIISGALGGIDIQAPQGVADALTLSTNGSAMVTFDTRGDEETATFAYEAVLSAGGVVGDNQQLIFGSDDDTYIRYETSDDLLVISGSSDLGVKLEGSKLTISNADANAVGGGFNGAEDGGIADSYVARVNGEIVTTLLVNIDDLKSSATDLDVIGENDTAAAYLTQITTAVNGIIYKVEMVCVETPAGSNAATDIDLVTNTAALAEDVAYTSTGTTTVLIKGEQLPSSEWEAGISARTSGSFDAADVPNAYLYLANGEATAGDATYTAGKFMIKLHGVSTF